MKSCLRAAAAAVLTVALSGCATPPPPAPPPAPVRPVAPPPPPPQVIAGVTVPRPLPPQPVVDELWGTSLSDPYRFVENTADPAVQAWMKSQADATGRIFERMPGRGTLLARIREIDSAAAGQLGRVQRIANGRLFFLKREPGENQFKLYWRERGATTDNLLVDAEAIGKRSGRPLAIQDYAVSPDGRRVAYALQVAGSEIGALHVLDVDTGRPLAAPIDRIRFSSASWLDDSSGLFFNRLREGYDKLGAGERFGDVATHFLRIGDGSAEPPAPWPVFSSSRNAELKLPIYAGAQIRQIPGTQIAAAEVFLGVERNRMLFVAPLADAIAGRAQWRKLVDATDEVRAIDIGREWVYLLSAKDAPRHRLLRMPLRSLNTLPSVARADVVLPAGEEVIVGMRVARDAVYVTRRRGAVLHLERIPHTLAHLTAPRSKPQVQPVKLPIEGTVALLDADPRQEGVLLSATGWTRATQRFAYVPPSVRRPARLEALALVKPGAMESMPGVVAREAMVKSHDGVEVPVSILARGDLKLDGSAPTVLFGYGSYGITENPFFNPRLLAWIERGGVYVFAHVRGGGVRGTEWHLAGRQATKPNTWRDAIAVAQWLVDQRYTSPQRLGIAGGSAGGIFVGRAITEAPQLFAAAVPAVGVMDMVRAETDPNGPANVPEFGTVKNEAGFRALLAMSSYHHLKDGVKYPATLLVHGVNDTRVAVWQSLKFANRMASLTAGGPVLLRLDFDIGHGQGSTLAQQQAQTADIWSFMLWQFGVPEFQPRN